MIVYSNTVSKYIDDVITSRIIRSIEDAMDSNRIPYDRKETRSWIDSTNRMALILKATDVPDDANVYIEYKIPFTGSRIDFFITGRNDLDKLTALIIEMKGWSEGVKPAESNGMVFSDFYGKETLHPSYQSWSYANYLRFFNSEVIDGKIDIQPCAYLYNYDKTNAGATILDPAYEYYTSNSPVFFSDDAIPLSKYINSLIRKTDNCETMERIENGKLTVSASLQKSLKDVLKNKDFFSPMEKQAIIYNKLLWGVRKNVEQKRKCVYIVRGGPGTGKSVLALKLLSELIGGYTNKWDDTHHFIPALYVTKTTAPRKTYSKELKSLAKEVGLEYLFKGASDFVGEEPNAYPVIIVDEAHRLTTRSSQYIKGGENQVMEIINAAEISIFMIDEDQRVSSKDLGTIDEIERWAKRFGANVISDGLTLETQFRCSGSDYYIAWLENLLDIRKSTTLDVVDKLRYDIDVVDTPEDLLSWVEEKRLSGKEARIVSGYCWKWISKNTGDPSIKDIDLGSIKLRWNSTTDTWANTESLKDEVGCIHSAQGMEFQYVGVIIGKDLVYRDNEVRADPSANHDSNIPKSKDNIELATRLIRNTYKTLMTRGQEGCRVYCEDKALADYIKKSIAVHR